MAKERHLLQVQQGCDGKVFFRLNLGQENHGRISLYLWVAQKLVKKDENGDPFIEFPIENATILKTEKGSLVIRPSDTSNIFHIFVPCGFRGGSEIRVLSEHEGTYKYEYYRSQRGSLGVSEGCLVVTKLHFVEYEWIRTGRTYGAPKKGVSKILLDNKSIDLTDVNNEQLEELCQLI